jgi:hypothetical protein
VPRVGTNKRRRWARERTRQSAESGEKERVPRMGYVARNGEEGCGESSGGGAHPSGRWGEGGHSVHVLRTCLLLPVFYAGGMRQSIVLKLCIVFAGVATMGGAVVWGLTQNKEVRGSSETAVQEPIPRADGAPETLKPAHEETEDWHAYMLGLRAEDYATYTHAVQGFSFDYPKAFALLPATWEDEEVIDLYHPTLPLGIRVSVHPFDPNGEVFADLAAIPEEYELEPPEGAQRWAVGWIDQDVPAPRQHRSVYWFRAHDRLFNIQLMAPDVEWLQLWMRQVAHTDFTLTQPSHDS